MVFIGDGAVRNTSLRACPHCHVSFKSGAQGVAVRLDKSLANPESQGLFCPACKQEISQQQFLEGPPLIFSTKKMLAYAAGISVGPLLMVLASFMIASAETVEDRKSFGVFGAILLFPGLCLSVVAVTGVFELARELRFVTSSYLAGNKKDATGRRLVILFLIGLSGTTLSGYLIFAAIDSYEESLGTAFGYLALVAIFLFSSLSIVAGIAIGAISGLIRLESGLDLSPPTTSDEDEYVRRCLTVEFRDEDESRTFRDDPAFTAVLTPLNSQRYASAITEAKKLLPRYENFDLVYKWLGTAYRATEQLEPSRQILREGLGKSKRKCMLLTDLGETEWLMGNVESGLYWLAQALHCLASNPIEHNAYLLLSYLAKGIGLQEEADLFLARVDRMRAGQIRLNAAHAERLMSLCRQGRTEPMRKVIRGLADKRLN
jgi:tetratricopeptide (TPR) repeat protein